MSYSIVYIISFCLMALAILAVSRVQIEHTQLGFEASLRINGTTVSLGMNEITKIGFRDQGADVKLEKYILNPPSGYSGPLGKVHHRGSVFVFRSLNGEETILQHNRPIPFCSPRGERINIDVVFLRGENP